MIAQLDISLIIPVLALWLTLGELVMIRFSPKRRSLIAFSIECIPEFDMLGIVVLLFFVFGFLLIWPVTVPMVLYSDRQDRIREVTDKLTRGAKGDSK